MLLLQNLWALFIAWFNTPTVVDHVVVTPPAIVPPAPAPVVTPPAPAPIIIPPTPSSPAVALLFDTPQNAHHSIRVLCDNAGWSLERDVEIDGRYYMDKDILCAVIDAESNFYNYLPSGKPTTHRNLNKDGSLSSTDWGICQVNDYFHIGANKDFPSVEYVMANPGKVVQWMMRMYAAGQINLWDAYNSGSYKKFLPQNA